MVFNVLLLNATHFNVELFYCPKRFVFVFQKTDTLKCELIVTQARGRSSAAQAVSLADVAQLAQAVQVVEPSVVVKVSAVFVSEAETVTGPAVGLTGFPVPGNTDTRTPVNPTLRLDGMLRANDSDLFSSSGTRL